MTRSTVGDTKRTDQFVLEILGANEETDRLHLWPRTDLSPGPPSRFPVERRRARPGRSRPANFTSASWISSMFSMDSPIADAPPVGTIKTPSASKLTPRRFTSVPRAAWSLTPSTSTTVPMPDMPIKRKWAAPTSAWRVVTCFSDPTSRRRRSVASPCHGFAGRHVQRALRARQEHVGIERGQGVKRRVEPVPNRG